MVNTGISRFDSQTMKKLKRQWGWFAIAVLFISGIASGVSAAMPPMLPDSAPTNYVASNDLTPLKAAFEAANAAANQAQTATTPEAWSGVATGWAMAIQHLQSVPSTGRQWLFAQRKAREYLANQAIAQRRAERVGAPVVFPTLGNAVLDEQLGVYLSYVATFGAPDILIMGSSRAIQGVDPQILQQRLSRQGLNNLKVYNFSVNGATAQVVSFLLQRILPVVPMPKLIVWAEGARAFNSGRYDLTFAKILESPGYTALLAGDRPSFGWEPRAGTGTMIARSPMPVTTMNAYGFMAVPDVFDPFTYYQQFPRVAGVYDSTYQDFNLEGVQTVSFRAISDITRRQKIPLVFVNLPLSSDYLDEARFFYERLFQEYLQREAAQSGFILVDYLEDWLTQDAYFADPSHLNQAGAAQIATKLAADPKIPWATLMPEQSDEPDESDAESSQQ
jgi:lysophospholipase L1-like esterase